eukprot:2154149-Heterocapsa_arctica.AAC.1
MAARFLRRPFWMRRCSPRTASSRSKMPTRTTTSRALHDTFVGFMKPQFEQSPRGQHHHVLIKLS